MAKGARTRGPRAAVAKGAPPSEVSSDRKLRWPVWASAILFGLYVLSHLSMIPVALELWSGLLSALLFGR